MKQYKVAAKSIAFIAFIVAVASVFTACPAICGIKPEATGSLKVVFNPGSRSLSPSVDTTATSFDIVGTGPGGASFSNAAITGSMLTKTALVPGSWTITATGKNVAGTPVLGASGMVIIFLGTEASLNLVLTPLAGTGTLSLNVSWTVGIIASPAISATLTSVAGTVRTIAFSPGADGHSLAFSTTDVATGYHTLELLLSDGGLARWSLVETVRIVKDAVTGGNYAITQTSPI